ncbi:recombinase family protein [Aquimarina longa]|uniref:recombinase family protein n=1 Tax=Aquimarina longa TaxID=1080221 RepID=UPI00078262E5|nr:hypothetical protein [Aquimarina longa]
MEIEAILRKHFAPYVLALIQQGAIIADTSSDDERFNIVPPNDSDFFVENPEGEQSPFQFVEQSESIDSEVQKQTRRLLEHIKAKAELEGKDPLELLQAPLISLLDDYKKTLLRNQELEEKLGKFDAKKNRKNASDKFAVEIFPHVVDAQKEGITSEAKIAQHFNDLGLKSYRGKQFNPSSIHYLLKRQKEMGLFDAKEDNTNSPDIG